MTTAKRHCSVCKAELKGCELGEISGQEGKLEVTVHRMPVLECPNGHRQFTNQDFALLLLDRLVEHDAADLPASEAKGVLIKHYYCTSCGAELDTPAEHRRTFHIDVDLPDIKRFDLELTVPVHRCARCGQEQIHSVKEVRSLAPAALAHAFKSAAIAAH